MVPAPHPMVPGTTETDYYQGKVTQAVPEQQAWVEARNAQTADGSAVPAGDSEPAAAAAGDSGEQR